MKYIVEVDLNHVKTMGALRREVLDFVDKTFSIFPSNTPSTVLLDRYPNAKFRIGGESVNDEDTKLSYDQMKCYMRAVYQRSDFDPKMYGPLQEGSIMGEFGDPITQLARTFAAIADAGDKKQ